MTIYTVHAVARTGGGAQYEVRADGKAVSTHISPEGAHAYIRLQTRQATS